MNNTVEELFVGKKRGGSICRRMDQTCPQEINRK